MATILLFTNLVLVIGVLLSFIIGWRSGFKYASKPEEAVAKKIIKTRRKPKPTKEQKHINEVLSEVENFEVE